MIFAPPSPPQHPASARPTRPRSRRADPAPCGPAAQQDPRASWQLAQDDRCLVEIAGDQDRAGVRPRPPGLGLGRADNDQAEAGAGVPVVEAGGVVPSRSCGRRGLSQRASRAGRSHGPARSQCPFRIVRAVGMAGFHFPAPERLRPDTSRNRYASANGPAPFVTGSGCASCPIVSTVPNRSQSFQTSPERLDWRGDFRSPPIVPNRFSLEERLNRERLDLYCPDHSSASFSSSRGATLGTIGITLPPAALPACARSQALPACFRAAAHPDALRCARPR